MDYEFEFSGGDICLDFCNTVNGKRGVKTVDRLSTFDRLVDWAEQGKLTIPHQATEWRNLARSDSEASESLLARAVALREAVFRLVASGIRGADPAPADLKRLNSEMRATAPQRELAWEQGRFGWTEKAVQSGPESILGKVAAAAAALLTSERLGRVRECGSDTCGWLFLDLTRNRSRRWCDMKSCGNVAKVRRHRARKAAV